MPGSGMSVGPHSAGETPESGAACAGIAVQATNKPITDERTMLVTKRKDMVALLQLLRAGSCRQRHTLTAAVASVQVDSPSNPGHTSSIGPWAASGPASSNDRRRRGAPLVWVSTGRLKSRDTGADPHSSCEAHGGSSGPLR